MTTMVYLRCEKDHANSIPMGDRHMAVGRACSRCGSPLMAEPERERPPRRPY